MADRATLLVRMPPTLKRRLVHEVEARGLALNDVAVGILAERFGVPFTPSGRRGAGPGGSGVVVLRLPAELKRRIQRAALDAGTNGNDVVVRALEQRLGVSPAGTTRRTPFGSGRRKEPMAS